MSRTRWAVQPSGRPRATCGRSWAASASRLPSASSRPRATSALRAATCSPGPESDASSTRPCGCRCPTAIRSRSPAFRAGAGASAARPGWPGCWPPRRQPSTVSSSRTPPISWTRCPRGSTSCSPATRTGDRWSFPSSARSRPRSACRVSTRAGSTTMPASRCTCRGGSAWSAASRSRCGSSARPRSASWTGGCLSASSRRPPRPRTRRAKRCRPPPTLRRPGSRGRGRYGP